MEDLLSLLHIIKVTLYASSNLSILNWMLLGYQKCKNKSSKQEHKKLRWFGQFSNPHTKVSIFH